MIAQRWKPICLSLLLAAPACEVGDDPICESEGCDDEAGLIADEQFEPESEATPEPLQAPEAWATAARMEAEDGIPRAVFWGARGLGVVPYREVGGQAVVGDDWSIGPVSEIADARERGIGLREVWFPDGNIDWFTDANGENTTAQDTAIRGAMTYLDAHSPLNLQETDSQTGELEFRSNNEILYCGYTAEYWVQDRNSKIIRLSRRCPSTVAGVLHEMGHALGFPHEFQRPDRNDFVDVCGYAGPDRPWNYGRLGVDIFWTGQDFSVLSPFDMQSVMHDGYKSCVQPLSGSWPARSYAGDATPLSVHDVNSIYRVYGDALGSAANGRKFGSAMAAGDFDDDGFEDLAVAANEYVRSATGRLRIYFFRGVALDSSEGGTGQRYMPWFVETVGFTAEVDMRPALAAGDFDGDGIADLAFGEPAYQGGQGRVGIYTLNTPTSSDPFAPWGNRSVFDLRWITPDQVGLDDAQPHRFGAALDAGHLSSNGYDDLLVGAPGAIDFESIGFEVHLIGHGGAVAHLRAASPASSTLTWNPGTGEAEFGYAVTVMPELCRLGNLAGFAVGAPGNSDDRGAVHVYGCTIDNWWNQQRPPLLSSKEHLWLGSRYGAAVQGFRTRNSSTARQYFLAVGAPQRVVGGVRSGRVYLDEYDRSGTRTAVTSLVASSRSGDDEFGAALAMYQPTTSGSLQTQDRTRIAIGVPGTEADDKSGAGQVYLWSPWRNGEVSSSSMVFSGANPVDDMRYGEALASVRDGAARGGVAIGATGGIVITFSGFPPTPSFRTAGLVDVRRNQGHVSGWSSDLQTLTVVTKGDRRPRN